MEPHSKYTKTNAVTERLVNRFFDAIAGLIRPLHVTHALEVGCGKGFSTQRLRRILPASTALEAWLMLIRAGSSSAVLAVR